MRVDNKNKDQDLGGCGRENFILVVKRRTQFPSKRVATCGILCVRELG